MVQYALIYHTSRYWIERTCRTSHHNYDKFGNIHKLTNGGFVLLLEAYDNTAILVSLSTVVVLFPSFLVTCLLGKYKVMPNILPHNV